MFTFAQDGNVLWPVKLVVRTADGEDPGEAEVKFLFRIFTRAERKAREQSMRGALGALRAANGDVDFAKAEENLRTLEDQAEADLRERVLGWRGIVGADGAELAFTPALRDALLNDEAHYARIAAGLNEASLGARAKNSSPGPAGSQAPGRK